MRLLILSIIFLFVAITLIIITLLYYLYWKPIINGTKCNINQDCDVNQYCFSGICREISCNNDSDCNNTSRCINSYCEEYRCSNSNDCPNNGNLTACNVDGVCINIGTTCQSNMDCSKLSCVNNICLQCTTNSNCILGQACFNNICRYPNLDEVSPNTFTFPSPSFDLGNVTAPKAYSCDKIGCSNINDEPIGCTGGDLPILCPSSCSFCVNSFCRCTGGENFETCRVNADCLSGLCNNNICVPIGNECASNAGGNILPCPINSPYCVDGKCSETSLGAICGGTGMPEDLCYSPQSLGKVTDIIPNGMGFFCVNGRCQNLPGELNQLCTTNSCTTYNNNTLTCREIVEDDITLNRCM